jgi:hypothetical protein
LLAAFSASFAAIVSCGGTAVLDAPDPKACPDGHGCPMAACICKDGSLALDTTCQLGECRGEQAVCDELCEGFDGTESVITSQNDEVPIPNCETFCTRLSINGCELGCDTLFSECLTPTTCGAAKAVWDCLVDDAVFTCIDNAVHISGCDLGGFALCETSGQSGQGGSGS